MACENNHTFAGRMHTFLQLIPFTYIRPEEQVDRHSRLRSAFKYVEARLDVKGNGRKVNRCRLGPARDRQWSMLL